MRTRPAIPSAAALLSLALCAAANGAGAAAQQTQPAAGGGRLTVTTRLPTGRGLWFVEFQEQAGLATRSGGERGRSLRGAANVDCGGAQIRIAKVSVFEQPNFTGAVLLDMGEMSEWRSPKPGSIMDRVLAAACSKTKAPARGGGAGRPGLNPPARPPAESGSPARAEVDATDAASTAPTAVGRAFYVQLASLPSADAARQAWDGLKGAAPAILDDRLRRLTATTVHGRRVYRVLAGGFGTRAQAETVCKALARLSARCFVRPGAAS